MIATKTEVILEKYSIKWFLWEDLAGLLSGLSSTIMNFYPLDNSKDFLHVVQSDETPVIDEVICILLPKLPFLQHVLLSQWLVVGWQS